MTEELSSRDLRMPEKKTDEAIVQVAPAPGEKKVSLHVSDAPVAEVLRGLAEMTGENVIFSSHVKERVTASLDDVTPEEEIERKEFPADDEGLCQITDWINEKAK